MMNGETESATPTTALEAPPTPAPETPPPAKPRSPIAEHQYEFGKPQPDKAGEVSADGERIRDASGRFVPKEKHRAAKDEASPKDAPRIAELTKRFRTAEQERDAIKAERDALKAERDALKTPPTVSAASQTVTPPRQDAPGTPIAAFDKPEPKLADFEASTDPYGDWLLAKAEWRLEKKQFEADQKALTEREAKEVAETRQRLHSDYERHKTAFQAEHPDFDEVVSAAENVELTPLLQAAILGAGDKGPAFVYYLAQHPDQHFEMLLHTHEKSVTPQAVVALQRVLTTRVQTASTGSVASPAPTSPASRPLNPVRTLPQATGEDSPSAGRSPIAAHMAKWGPKRA